MSTNDPGTACRAAAAALSGEAREAPGGAATVAASLDGVEVTAALAADGAARVACTAAGAGDLALRLYPEGLASGLGKVFGAQDVEVGESRIDERFMIKASDEGLARLWLGDEVRRQLAAAFPEDARGGFDLRLEAEAVSIAWSAASPDADRLEAAIRTAAALARRPAELLSQLRALADELDAALLSDGGSLWRPGGTTAISAPLPGGGEAVIDHAPVALASRRPTLHTRISATSAEGRALPGKAAICRPDAHPGAARLLEATLFERSVVDLDFSREFWVGVDRWSVLRDGLDEAWRRATLSAMPVAATISGEHVAVYLDGFVSDAARLRRGLALVSTLAGATRAAPRAPRPRLVATEPAPRSFAETWNRTPWADPPAGPNADAAGCRISGVDLSVYETMVGEHMSTLVTADGDADDLELTVAEGQLDFVSAAIGGEDIATGDGAFDERFVVRTNDPGYARIWLGAELRGAISKVGGIESSGEGRGYEYSIGRRQVRAARSQQEREPARLEQVVRVVTMLASRGRAIVTATRDLAAELGGALVGAPSTWDPEAGVPFTIGQGDAAVTVSQGRSTALGAPPVLLTRVHQAWATPRSDRFVVCTHARQKPSRRRLLGAKARLERFSSGDPVFDFTYWAGGEDRESLAARLDARTCSRIVLAAPEAIVSDRQEIDLWLPGFVVDTERLRLVLKVLGALGGVDLTAGPAGPYR
jgi:hypothetical protein